MNPNLVESWVNATNKKKSKEERAALVAADLALLPDMTDEKIEKQGICFPRKDGKLIFEGRKVKAMLKEAANIVKQLLPGGGIANLKSKVGDQVFVDEYFLSLGRSQPDATEVEEGEPDATEQKPIHVQTPQGKRDSIKVYEICRDVELEFTVRRLAQRGAMAVPESALLAILTYGQSIGLGADRSQGRGRFEILSVVKIRKANQDSTWKPVLEKKKKKRKAA